MKSLSSIIVIIFFSVAAFAQAGQLDSTFSSDGIVSAHPAGTFEYGFMQSVAEESTGKIFAGGWYKCSQICWGSALFLFNSNGDLDTNFGSNGITTLDGELYAFSIASDKKIVVSHGYITNYISRYNSDGSLDGSSIVPFYAVAITIQSDDKVIAISNSNSMVRLNEDLTADSSFGVNGVVNLNPITMASAALQEADGKIIVIGSSGTDVELARFNYDGTTDQTFGINGIVASAIGTATSAILQPDGKILVGMATGGSIGLMRFTSDGVLDSTFGYNGAVSTILSAADYTICKIAVRADSKIDLGLLGLSGIACTRFNADGTPDGGFGSGGLVTFIVPSNVILARSMDMQPDGKVLVAGSEGPDMLLARYIPGFNVGILNFSSQQSSPLIYPNPIQQTETLEYTLTQNESLTIAIYDINGKLIKNFISNEQRKAGAHKETLNIGVLPSGNYLLTLSNGLQKMSVKMVKQ